MRLEYDLDDLTLWDEVSLKYILSSKTVNFYSLLFEIASRLSNFFVISPQRLIIVKYLFLRKVFNQIIISLVEIFLIDIVHNTWHTWSSDLECVIIEIIRT